MSTAADAAIKICSRASTLIGGSPISSFSDGTVESDVANAMYEDIVRAALTNSRWRFATDQAVLNRLASAPVGRFSAAYQIPATSLMVNAVTISDINIEYDIYTDKIYCEASADEDVIADYIYRALEGDWPPYFITAVEYEMAALMAVSVARDGSLAKLFQDKAAFEMIRARRLDSQQQTTRKLDTTRFLSQRRS